MEINSSTGVTSSSGTQQTPSTTKTLDKDAFLEILVNQLRYQNPLEPQDSSAFVNQLVQFSTMEQMANLATNMEKLLDYQTASMDKLLGYQDFNRATGLIGKEVSLTGQDDVTVQGVVEKVVLNEGEPLLIINGQSYSLDNLVSIGQPPPPEPENFEPTANTTNSEEVTK